MKMKPNKLLTKRDALLIALVLIVGLTMLGIHQWRNNVDSDLVTAEIRSDYGTYFVCLNENRTFYIIPNVIFEVKDGQIAFVKSDCPDQVCVHAGFIRSVGQMAACLPNGLVLTLLGVNDYEELDIFARACL